MICSVEAIQSGQRTKDCGDTNECSGRTARGERGVVLVLQATVDRYAE
jgi:hypothetical protein